MEVFTEIMLRGFYPAWPDVSTRLSPIPQKGCFWGAAGSQSPAIAQPLSFLIFTWKWSQKNKCRGGDICLGGLVLTGFLGQWCAADTPPSSNPPIPHPAWGRVKPQPPQHVHPLDSLVVLSNLQENLKNCMRPHSGSYRCLLQNTKFTSLNSSPTPL